MHKFLVEVPETVSIVDDLILYMFRRRLLFMTSRGAPVLETGFFVHESGGL